MKTIRDERDLPEPPYVGSLLNYIRCKSDHGVLMHPTSGECYRRADGAPWTWPALRIDFKRDGSVTREPMVAWFDDHFYADRTEIAA